MADAEPSAAMAAIIRGTALPHLASLTAVIPLREGPSRRAAASPIIRRAISQGPQLRRAGKAFHARTPAVPRQLLAPPAGTPSVRAAGVQAIVAEEPSRTFTYAPTQELDNVPEKTSHASIMTKAEAHALQATWKIRAWRNDLGPTETTLAESMERAAPHGRGGPIEGFARMDWKGSRRGPILESSALPMNPGTADADNIRAWRKHKRRPHTDDARAHV